MDNQLVHANTDGTLTTTSGLSPAALGFSTRTCWRRFVRTKQTSRSLAPSRLKRERVPRFLRADTASPPTSRS
nr:MAG TPA: hypothetical protein [Caudoviricetes sp.]